MTFSPSFSHVFQVGADLLMQTSATNCTLREQVQSSRNLVYIPCLHPSVIILLSIKWLVGLLIKKGKKRLSICNHFGALISLEV